MPGRGAVGSAYSTGGFDVDDLRVVRDRGAKSFNIAKSRVNFYRGTTVLRSA
jgi:hypothetical protein